MYKPESLPVLPNWLLAGRRTGRILKTILLNVIVAAAILLVIEIGVRIFHPEITSMGTDGNLIAPSAYLNTPAPKPNAVGMSCGVEFRVDRYGFWKYAVAFDSTKPSWLLFGDSVTMGMGVEPDSTFAGRLAAAADSFNVLNAALIGYTSTDYRTVAEGLLRGPLAKGNCSFHFKRLTLFWCLNDAYEGASALHAPGQTVRQVSGGLLRFIKLHYYTYQWLKAFLFDRSRDYYLHDRSFYAAGESCLQTALRDLRHIHALARQSHVRFEIVLLPYQYQLRAENGDRLPQSVMHTALQNSGIPIHDATEFLRTTGGETATLYRYGDGIHFSPRGHAVLAKYLQRQLAGVKYGE